MDIIYINMDNIDNKYLIFFEAYVYHHDLL